MKLFAFYIGGATENSLIELHDVRFGVAEKIEDCYDAIRKSWWGTAKSLHIDCWGELTGADGHLISLSPEKPVHEDRLWFVNLGGYDPAEFTELHKNIFVVAPNESKAKVRALKTVLDWKSHHKDYQFDVEHICSLDAAAADKGLHIHLTPTGAPTPFKFDFGYNTAIRQKEA